MRLQDGSLQNGDHLLAIGDVRLWGMGAEQVAAILRQAGQDSIRLVVARPVDPTLPNYLVSECSMLYIQHRARLKGGPQVW